MSISSSSTNSLTSQKSSLFTTGGHLWQPMNLELNEIEKVLTPDLVMEHDLLDDFHIWCTSLNSVIRDKETRNNEFAQNVIDKYRAVLEEVILVVTEKETLSINDELFTTEIFLVTKFIICKLTNENSIFYSKKLHEIILDKQSSTDVGRILDLMKKRFDRLKKEPSKIEELQNKAKAFRSQLNSIKTETQLIIQQDESDTKKLLNEMDELQIELLEKNKKNIDYADVVEEYAKKTLIKVDYLGAKTKELAEAIAQAERDREELQQAIARLNKALKDKRKNVWKDIGSCVVSGGFTTLTGVPIVVDIKNKGVKMEGSTSC